MVINKSKGWRDRAMAMLVYRDTKLELLNLIDFIQWR